MKNIIYNETEGKVLALVTVNWAHDVAEALSYLMHRNSTYGLFGIRIVSLSELCTGPNDERFEHKGRKAWNEFIAQAR